MEVNSHSTTEPKREKIIAPNFSEHKELLHHLFNEESSDTLNVKQKQDLVNKLKKSLTT